jgi:hypothetical protein
MQGNLHMVSALLQHFFPALVIHTSKKQTDPRQPKPTVVPSQNEILQMSHGESQMQRRNVEAELRTYVYCLAFITIRQNCLALASAIIT